MTDLRLDTTTGRWTAIAPGRTKRPGASALASDERADCPFCSGHEERTPPETLRLGEGPSGWGVRVVPNLYPALERQEVVVHGPEHLHSLGELSGATLELVAEAWQRRARDAGGICFPFVNEGHEAGASLPHTHSQLAWLPAPPPAAVAERGLQDVEQVIARDGLVAGCPVASRVAYELLVFPEEAENNALTSELLGAALRLVGELVARLHRIRDGFTPLNVWLHTGIPDAERWHLEIFPRTTRLAGLELGAGMFIDPVAPEVAAAQLRDAG